MIYIEFRNEMTSGWLCIRCFAFFLEMTRNEISPVTGHQYINFRHRVRWDVTLQTVLQYQPLWRKHWKHYYLCFFSCCLVFFKLLNFSLNNSLGILHNGRKITPGSFRREKRDVLTDLIGTSGRNLSRSPPHSLRCRSHFSGSNYSDLARLGAPKLFGREVGPLNYFKI